MNLYIHIGLPAQIRYHKPPPSLSTDRIKYQHGYSYSEAEKAFLIANNDKMNDQELADALGRTIASVQRMRYIMGLKMVRSASHIISVGLAEAERMRTIEAKCIEIRRLQLVCANEPNSYKRYIAIDRLKKMSGISR